VPRPNAGTIDRHPERAAIEREIAIGRPCTAIARKYGLHKDAVPRYKAKLPAQLKAALAANALKPGVDLEQLRISESDHLLQNLGAQRARLLMMQDCAIEVGQGTVVAMLSAQIHRNLELVGKYLGEFIKHETHTSISILITPEYLELRTALIQALAPFPEARRAVAAALHRLESKAAEPPREIEGTAIAATVVARPAAERPRLLR